MNWKAFFKAMFFIPDPFKNSNVVNLRQERARRRLESIGSPDASVMAVSGFEKDRINLNRDHEKVLQDLAKAEQQIIREMLTKYRYELRKLRLMDENKKEMDLEDLRELQLLLEHFHFCYEKENVQDHIDKIRQLISEKENAK